MGHLRAITWLRWRLLVNGLRGGRRRDRWERVSRVLAVTVPVVLGLLLLAVAGFFCWLAWSGGRAAAMGESAPLVVMALPRVLLLGLLALLVLVPLGGAPGLDRTRLLLLPIPRRALHDAEVLARVFDPWIAVAIPGLAALALAIASAGRTLDGLLALVAGAAMVLVLATVGQLAASLARWILRDRRRGEWFTLGFVLLVSLAGLLPVLSGEAMEERFGEEEGHFMETVDAALPAWTRALPTELYGRAVEAQLDEREGQALLALVLLIVEALLLYALSARVHARLLDGLQGAKARAQAVEASGELWRPRWLAAPTAAVAMAQARTAMRCVRGRVAVLLPGPMVALLGVVMKRVPDELPGSTALFTSGPMLLGAGGLFAIYSLQAITMNQLASDRAGLSLQLLAPISSRQLLRGKALGGGMVAAVAVALCFLCALIAAPGGPPLRWMSALVATAATYVALVPFSALTSVLLPRDADLTKTGNAGNPHTLAMLAGVLLAAGFGAVPGLAMLQLRGQAALTFGLTCLWLVLVALLSIPALNATARALDDRRENLALVAQGR